MATAGKNVLIQETQKRDLMLERMPFCLSPKHQLLFKKFDIRRIIKLVHRYFTSQDITQHKVFVSLSTDIYDNLAFEDWLYENTDLEHESILLLWKNEPAIVIGRHQNPWLECNIPECLWQDVDIARRKSGGGTVYHDTGNLNCSFIKRRDLYNRKQNLELVIHALKTRWNINLSLNKREDIVLDEKYKISGTASKLGGKRTYHHFTLLYDVNKDKLNTLLHSNVEGVMTNATKSTRMAVANLRDRAPDMDFHSLVDVISSKFCDQFPNSSVDTVIPVDEGRYPDIVKHLEELKSWEWVYGKTPPFTIERQFRTQFNDSTEHIAHLKVKIEKGHVHNLNFNLSVTENIHSDLIKSLEVGLEGTRLCRRTITNQLSHIKTDWISNNYYSAQTQQVLDWYLHCVIQLLPI